MKSPYHKGQKLIWKGSVPGENDLHSFPSQEVEVLSTDGKKGMTLVQCYIHFKPESGTKHPKYRERWVLDSELSKP